MMEQAACRRGLAAVVSNVRRGLVLTSRTQFAPPNKDARFVPRPARAFGPGPLTAA